MVSQSKSILTVKKEVPKSNINISVLDKYIQYTENQSNQGVIWFLKVIILIPCVFMVFSIIAMSMTTSNFEWFIGVSMILFFSNLIAHIGETKSTFFVPLYHATVALLFIIPFITYLINS